MRLPRWLLHPTLHPTAEMTSLLSHGNCGVRWESALRSHPALHCSISSSLIPAPPLRPWEPSEVCLSGAVLIIPGVVFNTLQGILSEPQRELSSMSAFKELVILTV